MDLRELVRNLYGIDRFQGCTSQEIEAMRQRFGALPPVVEDFWRTFGQTKWLNQVQDTWCFPNKQKAWSWLEDIDGLVLLNENQSVCQAGIRREDLTLPDPPVYIAQGDDPWELSAPAVSEFLAAALTYEAVFTYEYNPEDIYWLSEEDRKIVQERLNESPFVLKNWFASEIRFYSNRPDNLVVVMDLGDEYQCLYGGATQESYTALLEVMEDLGEPL